ncbi:hypothetical protein [Salipiger thiooxidans]|uniref:hypothetical protein n=1 Tax=Salipiger thiooxidans TaxID=282683 RepID=UPI001CD56BB1|nr:hypothetical protein [Salipiger thiooxidans]MCA0847182.1 hypothetical protein [Salipiger thiooxidans]
MSLRLPKIEKLTIQKIERNFRNGADRIDVTATASAFQIGATFHVTETVNEGNPLPDNLIESCERRIRELLELILQDLKA